MSLHVHHQRRHWTPQVGLCWASVALTASPAPEYEGNTHTQNQQVQNIHLRVCVCLHSCTFGMSECAVQNLWDVFFCHHSHLLLISLVHLSDTYSAIEAATQAKFLCPLQLPVFSQVFSVRSVCVKWLLSGSDKELASWRGKAPLGWTSRDLEEL